MGGEWFQSTLPSQGATDFPVYLDGVEQFQSTLPSQGATFCHNVIPLIDNNFNPRSPHRERPSGRKLGLYNLRISIHAPLTGSDSVSRNSASVIHKFQSTLPSQGATANIHIKFLCDLLFSTLSSKNSFTLSRFPQTITWFCAICTDKLCANVPLYLCTLYIRTTLKTLR